MFVPSRAMCPSCFVMHTVLRDQLMDGTILITLENHKVLAKECLGSGIRVVTPNEIFYEKEAA